MKLYKLVKTKWNHVEEEFNNMLKLGTIVSFHFVNSSNEGLGILFELSVSLGYAVGDCVKANAPGFSENGKIGVVKAIHDGGLVDVYYAANQFEHACDSRIWYNHLIKML